MVKAWGVGAVGNGAGGYRREKGKGSLSHIESFWGAWDPLSVTDAED